MLAELRFPIPTVTEQSAASSPPMHENWDTKIRGTVACAHLILGQAALDSRRIARTPASRDFGWRYLLAGPEEVAGVIWTSTVTSDSEYWPANLTSLDAELAECIAISKGELHHVPIGDAVGVDEQQYHSWELARKSADGAYRFYNVMWIERSAADACSYRRAVGRVDQALWDRLQPEQIEVLLG